jgi:exosortase E/protease (VPEID-CTERM system)
MSSMLAPAEDRVSSSAFSASRLFWRIGAFFLILAVEIILISSQAQHVAFSGAHGLAGLLFTLGTWKIRAPITLAVIFLLFWQAKGRQNVHRISAWQPGRGIAWRWLVLHLGAISFFALLSSRLLNHPSNDNAMNGLVLLCLALGVAAVVSCAFAFLPAKLWREIFRGTGDAWLYVVVLGAGACVAATVAERIWYPLARWTLFLSAALLRPFLPGLSIDPAARVLGTPNFLIEVAPGCSGYEGIGLILVFTTACLWFFRREWLFPRALLLIPVGVATIWLSNAVRVAGLVYIGSTISPDVAMKGFHSHIGWILFNGVALGTCLLARRVSWITASGPVASGPAIELPGHEPVSEIRDRNAVAAYLMPFVAILAAGLMAGAASAGFEWLYPVRIVAAAVALWYFRNTYRQLDWRVGWSALAAGAAVFLLWIGLDRLLGMPSSGIPPPLAQAAPSARSAWILLRIIGAVVTVPIAEELAFRGFLLRRLVSADFESVAFRTFQWLPFVISSVVFGALHGERWLAGTLAGMVYALVLCRKGRMGEAVIAHASTNALLAAWVLSTGQWQLW